MKECGKTDNQRFLMRGHEFFKRMFALNPSCSLVSENGDNVLFQVRIQNDSGIGEVRFRALMRGSECVIEYIHANPEGEGFASEALAQFERVARELGYARIIADTAMTGAVHMWRKNGYDYVGAATDMVKHIR